MSSDDFFDEDLDSEFLNEIDAIEAAALSPQKLNPTRSVEISDDSDDFDMSMNFNDEELQELDNFIQDSYQGKAVPVPGPSRLKQTTLWGQPPPEATVNSASKTASSGNRGPFGKQSRKVKVWDRTAFAKSGWKKPKTKRKGDEEDGEGAEEEVEFEQFPAPFISIGPPPPMQLVADREAIKHWIYPLNQNKREYQFNIVKRCLFDNTLVALPTGLGKTFIAGVVMLNFYRWFPTGKVIFVAPTKPLVAQQIEACHRTCGIPGSDAAELTGEVTRATRNREWLEKRVFYMTPQTLINDLSRENCDPSSIILLVVDEAHKGKGDYAYAQVVRFMMAKNPHFRLLALTATPGSTPDAVQEIVDSLHISHIEIRDEESIDLRQYMFKKKLELHIIKMDGNITQIRNLLSKMMEPLVKKIQGVGLLQGYVDVATLHPYRCQAAAGEARGRRKDGWIVSSLYTLGSLARGMGYLIEASVGMCYDHMIAIVEGETDSSAPPVSGTTKTKKNTKMGSDPNYQAIIKELELQKRRPNGFVAHPKMEKLKMLVIQHFASKTADPDIETGEGAALVDNIIEDTRVMVFVTYRNCVEEIVAFLNQEQPLIKATKFIGQATDKDGNRGFGQREQLDVIRRFKEGEFNVLVSTSIGEEGLDIGEIDLIVCYDAQKTPIRMLQRVGRTGRKREGHVHVLLSEGREEHNWSKAQESYQEVQHSIVRGDQLELYADAERLIPNDVKPECKEMVMEIKEFVRGGKGKAKASAKSSTADVPKKRKRDEEVGRNIPAGASTGFVSVKDLIVKGAAKKRKKNKGVEICEEDLESDDEDRIIEAGFNGPRRTVSASAAVFSKSRPKKKSLKRSVTTVNETKRKKKSSQASITDLNDLTSSQFERMGQDDSDDVDIERGFLLSPVQLQKRRKSPYTDNDQDQGVIVIDLSSPSPEPLSSSPGQLLQPLPTVRRSNSVVSDIARSISKAKHRTPSMSPRRSSTEQSSSGRNTANNVGWLVDDDDEGPNLTIEIVNSSPSVPPVASLSLPEVSESEVETVEDFCLPPRKRRRSSLIDDDIELTDDDPLSQTLSPEARPSTIMSSPDRLSSPSPQAPKAPIPSQALMPPPPVPFRLASTASAVPESSFPIRPVHMQLHKRSVAPAAVESSPLAMPPSSQRRLHRFRSSSPDYPSLPPRKKNKDVLKQRSDLVETEAAHSGDEVSAGSSLEGDLESESDRQFLKDSPDTQVSPSYNQTLAYRESLMSQAPTGTRGPIFSRPPVRSRPFGIDKGVRYGASVSPSSPGEHDEEDEYMLGSFVVDDDAELSFVNSSSEV